MTTGRWIAVGRGGGACGPCGRVLDRHFYDRHALGHVASAFRTLFPSFADVRLRRGWGGAVDRSPGYFSLEGRVDPESGVLYGIRYLGNDVAPSALTDRILGRLATRVSPSIDTRKGIGGV